MFADAREAIPIRRTLKSDFLLVRREADAGIVIDGAGIGSAIAANKIRGIRAAMPHRAEMTLVMLNAIGVTAASADRHSVRTGNTPDI